LIAIENAKSRVQSDEMKMLAQQAGAKAMQRADLGPLDLGQLHVQPGIVGMALQSIAQGLLDAALHLGGRGFGKRDYQELIHITRRLGVADEISASLREHRRLAR